MVWFFQQFFLLSLPSHASPGAQGQGRRVLGTLEVLTPLSCLDQGYVWFSTTPRLQFPVKKVLNSKPSAHLGSFRKVKTRQRPNSHVWHQKGSCPICSYNIITAQPMTLEALTAGLGQGQTLMESQDFTGAQRKEWVQHGAKVLGAGQDWTHLNVLLSDSFCCALTFPCRDLWLKFACCWLGQDLICSINHGQLSPGLGGKLGSVLGCREGRGNKESHSICCLVSQVIYGQLQTQPLICSAFPSTLVSV